jgi:hypothetical protein
MIIETLETRVRECEALARTTSLPDKATWTKMAERWRQLANYHTSTESRLQEKRRDRKISMRRRDLLRQPEPLL